MSGRRAWSVMGDTTNLAARVAHRAPPAARAGDAPGCSTRRRSRGRSRSSSRSPPRASRRSSMLPIVGPAGGGRRQAAPAAIIGREAERALLLDAQRSARAGAGQVVVVTGGPGLGKSWLISSALGDDVRFADRRARLQRRDPLRGAQRLPARAAGDPRRRRARGRRGRARGRAGGDERGPAAHRHAGRRRARPRRRGDRRDPPPRRRRQAPDRRRGHRAARPVAPAAGRRRARRGRPLARRGERGGHRRAGARGAAQRLVHGRHAPRHRRGPRSG